MPWYICDSWPDLVTSLIPAVIACASGPTSTHPITMSHYSIYKFTCKQDLLDFSSTSPAFFPRHLMGGVACNSIISLQVRLALPTMLLIDLLLYKIIFKALHMYLLINALILLLHCATRMSVTEAQCSLQSQTATHQSTWAGYCQEWLTLYSSRYLLLQVRTCRGWERVGGGTGWQWQIKPANRAQFEACQNPTPFPGTQTCSH